MKIYRFLALIAFWSVSSHAYIVPVAQLIEAMFEGRKTQPSIELTFRHFIRVTATDNVEIEEILFSDRGRLYSWFKAPSAGVSVFSALDSRGYSIEGGRAYPTRSRAFIRYFFNHNAADFRELLRSEKFIRLNQLLEFRPGSSFEGDPGTWDIKGNYIRHDDVFLTRLNSGVGVQVVGYSDQGTKRSVVFGREIGLLRRLEWIDAQESYAWNFSAPFRSALGSYLPKALSFEMNGVERISSELLSARPISDKAVNNLRTVARQTARGTNPLVDSALGLLLSFR